MAVFLFISISFLCSGQNTSPFIVTDQFGYLPGYAKIAVIKNPQVGFDASLSFTPGAKYALMNAKTGDTIFQAAPIAWKNGATDTSSGDKAWHFDFTSVNENRQLLCVRHPE